MSVEQSHLTKVRESKPRSYTPHDAAQSGATIPPDHDAELASEAAMCTCMVWQPGEQRPLGPAEFGVRGPVPSRGRAACRDGQGDGAVHRERPRGEEARVAASAGGTGEELHSVAGVARRAQAQHRLRRGPVPQQRRGMRAFVCRDLINGFRVI
jgi:hypothetical protein